MTRATSALRAPAMIGAIALLALAARSDARAAGPLRAGQVAPAFALPKTSGGNLSLASLRGKAVYLNFFASWCAPCNEEAPTIRELYQKYHARGLETVGIDEQENAAKAVGFMKRYKLPYQVVVDGGDMGKNYGIIALPVHVFIDRKGKVKLYRTGEMLKPEIEAAIKSIL